MVTERTTKQIMNSCINKESEHFKYCNKDQFNHNQVWVLKEDVIKILQEMNASNTYINSYGDGFEDAVSHILNKLNSPPDANLTTNSISTSVLKKDSEEDRQENKVGSTTVGSVEQGESSSKEDNNNLRCEKHNLLLQVSGDGSTKFFYCKTCDLEKAYEDYKQEGVIHCPKQECKGMLLTSPYKHELKCSDCGKYFVINNMIEEVCVCGKRGVHTGKQGCLK